MPGSNYLKPPKQRRRNEVGLSNIKVIIGYCKSFVGRVLCYLVWAENLTEILRIPQLDRTKCLGLLRFKLRYTAKNNTRKKKHQPWQKNQLSPWETKYSTREKIKNKCPWKKVGVKKTEKVYVKKNFHPWKKSEKT